MRKKVFWFSLIAASAVCGMVAGGFFAFTRDLPQIRSLETFQPSAVTRIYSSDRVLLAELYAEKRDPVPLHMIPENLRKALIATEDRSFYTHSGVDLKGILRAIVRNFRAGEYAEGASTITQQLAKTLFLTPRKTLMRKIKEAILAFQLERRYTKDEILALYLNQVYFGSGAYGVQTAALRFFGKSVTNLDLAQCALIAAMPKAPSRFSPLVNPDLAVKRRNIVLKQMRAVGIVTEADFTAATAQPLHLADRRSASRPAHDFVHYVRNFLEETVGASRLFKEGLTVATTLDFTLQKAAERAVTDGLSALATRMEKRGLSRAALQSALVCLDVRSGGVLAMIGGRDFSKIGFNRAVHARRQSGSAFKPLVYALAIEKGFEQNRVILDAPVAYKAGGKGGQWRPENFSRTYQGEITLRKALALSKNIPAVRLIEMLGPSAAAAFARTLGIRSVLSPNLSLVLGTSETALIEMTSAYAVFPNRGERTEPFGVNTVVDSSGRTVWRAKPQKSIVMTREGAAIMVDMLQGVVTEGTGREAARIGRPVAGKTGTTDGYKDALFIGFSADLATGVWVGQDRGVTLGRGETGARAALPIWIDFMMAALENRPYRYFDMPDGVARFPIDPVTGLPAPADAPETVAVLLRKAAVSAAGQQK